MRRAAVVSAVALGLTACGSGDGAARPAATGPATTPAQAARGSSPTVVASHLEVPWGIAFLPGGDALIGERPTGRILRLARRGGRPHRVMTVPGVAPTSEGGLLGLAVSPRYSRDHRVYAYLTTSRDNRIVWFTLRSKRLHPILTGLRKGEIHDGGRIAFGPDGRLYAGVGETGEPTLAQDRGALNGKILRMEPDGSVPRDNPFPGSLVWTLGHRNVQGLAWDGRGRMWATEFGQNRVDEVNRIVKGHDYGWPVVEGRGDTHGGRYTNPQVTWTPTSTSSPSGAAIVGDRLYVGALAGQTLWRIPLHGGRAGAPQALYRGRYGRIRTVVAAPGGRIWFTTSNRDGRGSPSSTDDRILSIPAR
jgi:glucose/arabinose dehydrogenase